MIINDDFIGKIENLVKHQLNNFWPDNGGG